MSGEQARAPEASAAVHGALDTLFEVQPHALLVLDAALRVVYANRAAEDLTQRSRAELAGLAFDELVSERFQQEYRDLGTSAAARPEPRAPLVHARQALRGKDGTEIAVDLMFSRLHLGATELFLASFCNALDDAASRTHVEAHFRHVFDASPHAIGITDLQTGRLLEVNRAFERTFGHTREQAVGKTATELEIWKRFEDRERTFNRLVQQGFVRDVPVTANRRDGTTLELIVNSELVRTTSNPYIITYADDVTESHANKLALAASEQRFAKAFQASPDALAIVEAGSSRLLEVNDGFVRLFGRTREEVLGRSSFDFGLLADPEERARAGALLIEQGSLRDFPVVTQTPSGITRECLLSAESLDLGERTGFILIVRDVTAQLRSERARADLERHLRQSQKLEALGTLAGGIAHDFNNILAAILACTDLIKLDAEDPVQVQSHAALLSQAAERAANLVRQILTFSRKQPQQPRRAISLEAPVLEALALVRTVLPTSVELDVHTDPSIPIVLGDPTLIHQVVMNLCTNAAQAMAGNKGKLSVRLEAVVVDQAMASAHPALTPRRYARITVQDTGVGMTPETQKRLFEPFFTTRAPGAGTGLGLSVAHGIVREYEGAITVQSTVGQGTTFCVYLPQYEAELHEIGEPSPHLSRGNGELIILVDDEEMLCRSISGLLQRLGYTVKSFSDPRVALSDFEHYQNTARALITDLTMPNVSGVDLARVVHAKAPQLPILLMTGFAGEHSPQELKAVGIYQLVHKPVSAMALSESINDALRVGDSNAYLQGPLRTH
ncbi:MAG TPA: PAS domain S-box protein [Polyangiaceae bacterium]|nr:PAS domain S-box protein [Polyangiaceae bacterium]